MSILDGSSIVGDEEHSLRPRNGVGERLGELGVARELLEAQLAELVGAEIGLIVVERPLHRRLHPVDVPGVLGVVIDRQLTPL
jgi:hypothetical protein